MEILFMMPGKTTFLENGHMFLDALEIGQDDLGYKYWRRHDATKDKYSEWIMFDYNINCWHKEER